jgi:branched-chain amino acid transport system permease protein
VTHVIQDIVNWLALGSIYALLALGIAVVFSVLGLINFAHGELVTIAGYSMLFFTTRGVPWALVIPFSIAVTGLAAMLMERIAYRPLRGAPVTTTVLVSLGLSIVIQNAFLLFVGARPRVINFPSWTNADVHIGGVVLKWLDVATLATTFVILAAVLLFLRRSVRGIALRAAAENFSVTRLMGIRANAVVGGAFLLSGLLAGIAAFFYFGTASLVDPTAGFIPLLKGFVAAVIGGLGSLSGAVLGGFVLAGFEELSNVLLPASVQPFSDAVVFGTVIVVLLVMPRGLRAERSAQVERV